MNLGQTTDDGATQYVWDASASSAQAPRKLLAELDEALATLAQYTDFPGVRGGSSSVHSGSGSGGASGFFAPDLSGNVRQLLNATQGIQEASLYSAFGEPLAGASASPLGFGGGLGYYEDALDRLYVRARHYQPAYGRWMSRDPLGGFMGGYEYVGNRAVGLVDPSGWQGAFDGKSLLFGAIQKEWPWRQQEVDPPDHLGQADRFLDRYSSQLSLATMAAANPGVDLMVTATERLAALRQAQTTAEAAGAAAAAARAKGAPTPELSARARQGWEARRNSAVERARQSGNQEEIAAAEKAKAAQIAKNEAAAKEAADLVKREKAAAEAAEAAAKAGAEAESKLAARVAAALGKWLPRLEKIAKLAKILGVGLAVYDLINSIRKAPACLEKRGCCTPYVCLAPVALAVCEIVAAPVAFKKLNLGWMMFWFAIGLGCTGWYWWHTEHYKEPCFT